MVKYNREYYREKYAADPRYSAGTDDFDNEYSVRNNESGLYFETERIRSIFTVLNRQRICFDGKRILDIGCNYGFYSNLFAYLKRDTDGVYGVDFIQNSIDTAKRINGGIRYQRQDLYEGLEFEDRSFDFILVNYVLNCITENRVEVCKDIESKLKTGGHLLLFDFFGDFQANPIEFLEGLLRFRNPMNYMSEKFSREQRMNTHPRISKAEVADTLTQCEIIDYTTMKVPQSSLKYRWKKLLNNICDSYAIDRYAVILLRKVGE